MIGSGFLDVLALWAFAAVAAAAPLSEPRIVRRQAPVAGVVSSGGAVTVELTGSPVEGSQPALRPAVPGLTAAAEAAAGRAAARPPEQNLAATAVAANRREPRPESPARHQREGAQQRMQALTSYDGANTMEQLRGEQLQQHQLHGLQQQHQQQQQEHQHMEQQRKQQLQPQQQKQQDRRQHEQQQIRQLHESEAQQQHASQNHQRQQQPQELQQQQQLQQQQ
eukprot:CAMPEP_0168377024 /NCGR_PEP_ID=MMETSP0228-20121227/10615_1 /TAXON_ID=133427 /ORGANISM="Protoceratium reticulatum, Strain CCCM 535 (=CCMP 1889)" /LENGTH=222 /DNA_ID=CAMNT_0008390013 /DNA_START=82 /DNA_END=747 /DNA_ORIENTATION=+